MKEISVSKAGQLNQYMATLRRPMSRARGAAAVEFAILLIPMLILCFGIVEYGRAIYQYNAVAKAVRDAVRLVAQNNPSDAAYPAKAAKCWAVYGNAACSGTSLVPGLTIDNVFICDRINPLPCAGAADGTFSNVSTGIGTINLVEVRISGFNFQTLNLPFLGNTSNFIKFGPIYSTMRQVS